MQILNMYITNLFRKVLKNIFLYYEAVSLPLMWSIILIYRRRKVLQMCFMVGLCDGLATQDDPLYVLTFHMGQY